MLLGGWSRRLLILSLFSQDYRRCSYHCCHTKQAKKVSRWFGLAQGEPEARHHRLLGDGVLSACVGEYLFRWPLVFHTGCLISRPGGRPDRFDQVCVCLSRFVRHIRGCNPTSQQVLLVSSVVAHGRLVPVSQIGCCSFQRMCSGGLPCSPLLSEYFIFLSISSLALDRCNTLFRLV